MDKKKDAENIRGIQKIEEIKETNNGLVLQYEHRTKTLYVCFVDKQM
jgi:hypothetical protein